MPDRWRIHRCRRRCGELARVSRQGAGEVLVKTIDAVGLLGREFFISGKTMS